MSVMCCSVQRKRNRETEKQRDREMARRIGAVKAAQRRVVTWIVQVPFFSFRD